MMALRLGLKSKTIFRSKINRRNLPYSILKSLFYRLCADRVHLSAVTLRTFQGQKDVTDVAAKTNYFFVG
jgi:hypothetical protein